MKIFTSDRGFSLIELMIVVAIIGILAAVATPAYITHLYRVRENTAVQQLMNVKMAQEKFYTLNDQYATNTTSAAFAPMLDFNVTDTSIYLYSIATTNPSVRYTAQVQADLNQDGTRASCWSVTQSATAPVQDTTTPPCNQSEGFKLSLLTNLF